MKFLAAINPLWTILSSAILILLTLPDPPPILRTNVASVSLLAAIGVVGVLLGLGGGFASLRTRKA